MTSVLLPTTATENIKTMHVGIALNPMYLAEPPCPAKDSTF